MGRKGAQKAAESKQLEKLNKDLREAKISEDLAKLAAEQANSYQVNSEGDVLPPDKFIPLKG
ncbi:MAG: hypothetical protein AAB709_02160 [Patescibacteria group bacterium]